MTNPLESVDEATLNEQLCSPSELLIRRNDIIQRWKISAESGTSNILNQDLRQLYEQPDERWDHYNVLGQVINVIREEESLKKALQQQSSNAGLTGIVQSQTPYKQHVKIPADYKVSNLDDQ